MIFGTMAVDEAVGAVLAHAQRAGTVLMKKGRVLTAEDAASLRQAGIEAVMAFRLEAGDVGEDEAAGRLATAVTDAALKVANAFTGRANIESTERGVLVLDEARLLQLNAVDEAVTLGTLPPYSLVEPGQMVATVKIIPFAIADSLLVRCLAIAAEAPLLRVAPFQALRYRLIQTLLPGTSAKMLDKTERVTEERLAGVAGRLVGASRCGHTIGELADAIRGVPQDHDVLLIAGASAISDRRDVIPAAIERVGGEVRRFGMPVDPGNLLLLARLEGRPVLGLPGCCRSPKLNGFDWVLQRLAAGIEVTPEDVARMAVGGLLGEIPSRPQPRDEPAEPQPAPRKPRVAAVVLAAGQSRRMGKANKLLLSVDGKPMLRHVVEAAMGAGLREVVVVTGHEQAAVEAALADLPVRYVHNPHYADGLSTSLKAGIAALGRKIDGALVCLGDMPRVTAGQLRQLVDAFDPTKGRSIIVPTHGGKRGNPVLWGREHFAAMQALAGDVGARHLIGQHETDVALVELDDAASLLDIDTPEALQALTGAAA